MPTSKGEREMRDREYGRARRQKVERRKGHLHHPYANS